MKDKDLIMVTEEMVNAYISEYVRYQHKMDKRTLCRRGLEAALACEAFGLKDAIKQTREIYQQHDSCVAVNDALDYLSQLTERNSV